MKKTVVIAAAGKGSRLGAGLPKCLIEVNGHAVFEYQMKALQWADEIRMVVGYRAEEVIRRVSAVNDKVVFVWNEDYAKTTTLQSNFLGAEGIGEKALFIDGDMLLCRGTGEELCRRYEENECFIGVSRELSQEPVYAGVEGGYVRWFSYEKPSSYEWANVALIDTKMLEYAQTHFYVQLEKYLPLPFLEVERLEIDTREDFLYAEQTVRKCPEKYNFWR